MAVGPALKLVFSMCMIAAVCSSYKEIDFYGNATI